MTGETDLATMLRTLDIDVRDGRWALLTRSAPDAALDAHAAARIDEREGITYVVPKHVARDRGESPGFVAAWLSLRVHSSLDAIGLTAAVSRALADAGIACNVLAGFHHDHLLVPAARREDAVAALHALRGN
ncbi:MAG TPA: ACT domain-containing protein [Lysobacter sp.]|nr:ACT domain-containing protein [Lysobacter sp.]